MRSWFEDLNWFEDLVDFVLGLLFSFGFGVYYFFFTSHLFPIAPLFLWVLATIPYFPLHCPWPHYNLKRPFDPHIHVFVV